MSKRKNRWIQKGLAWVLTLAMVLGTVVTSDFTAVVAQAAEISLTESAGYEEGAYVEWAPVDGADGYIVYASKDGGTTWNAIDDQLIRKYADHYRADALGLTAGTWQLKVEAATFDTDKNKTGTVAEKTTDNLTVTNYDRSGFAFSTASRVNPSEGLGAYNADGSLKSGAQVIYVTASTAKTVKATVNGTEVTGLQAILAAKEKKNTSGDILDIRIIGKVSLADLDSIGSKEEGLQIKGNGSYTDMNITIEGVGEDAVVYGFGMLVRNCSDVELRNFALMYFLDDGISLDTENSNIWVHDLDIFYGQPGSASDQVKGDGSVDLKGDSQYITISYNHFYDSGKCSLCGMKSESGPNYITYHHNWFDHSDSRHPRIRTMSVHVYNNYYDGNAKYGVGAAYQSSAFVENNYFRNCKNPMLSSQQGSDRYDGEVTKKDSGIFPNSKGTFSSEDGGIIKAYNNVMEGKYTFIPYGSDTYIRGGAETAFDLMYVSSDKTDVSTSSTVDFDAYVVTDRTTVVPDTVTAKQGGSKYTNFDTEVDLGVALTAIDAPEDVPEKVTAKAGRLKGTDGKGDFDWRFDNSVDDTSAAVNDALKTAVANYTSSLVAVGGIAGASTIPVYTVTFDPANGDATWNVEVNAGDKLTEPAAPTVPADKDSFDGWYNGTTKWNFNNTVTADMTLTAKYLAAGETPDPGDATVIIHDFTKDGTTSSFFTISGNLNSKASTSAAYNGATYSGKGLKMESATSITFTAASAGTLVLVNEAGFTGKTKVDGEKQAATDGIISVSIAAGNHEITKGDSTNLYAIYFIPEGGSLEDPDPTVTKYTVTFNSNGGSAVASQKVPEGSKVTAPTAPTKEGFLFDGWYTDAALTQSYDFSTAVTADLILYAKWKDDPSQNKVTIKLNASDLEEKEYLETFTQGAFTIHAGDGKDENGKNNQSVTVDASNKTVDGVKYTRRLKTGGAGTADYRSVEFTTTGKAEVTVVAASSSSSADRVMGLATKNAEDGTLTDVTTFTVTGTAATFTYTLDAAGTYYLYSHEGGINFYAVTVVMEKTSTPAPATYTVTFNANGGSAVAAQTVESGKTATEPAAPTKDNFDFGGWYTDENCTTAYDFATLVTADITLYAKWTQKTIPSTDGDDKGLYVKLADPDAEYVYTGKAIAPAIIVTNNGEELVAGVDYTVKYSNNVNAAAKDAKKAPTVTVTGKGNLTGKATQTFTILPKSLLDEDVQAQPVVTSNAAKAVPVIVYNGMTLKKNKDFTFQYNAETKEFAVNGAGNYVTEKDAPLMISVVEKAASDLKKFAVTVGKEKLYYNGAEQTPVVTVTDAKDKTKVLTEGTDYVIAWPLDTTNAGTVKFNVIGLGDYAGSVAKSYKINSLAATAEVKTDAVAKDGYTFDAKGVTIGQDLALTVQTTVDGQKTTLELVEGKDYTVSYSANKKVGTNTAKYTFKFLGNFKGTKAAAGTFSIVPASLADLHEDGLVQVAAVGKTVKKAGVYKTVPYVSVNGTALKKSDMILTYYIDEEMTKEMTKATPVEVGGTVYVKIVGKGNYAAKDAGDFISTVYKVVNVDKTKDLSKAKIVDAKTGKALGKQEYTGEEIKPEIKVMIGAAEVPEDTYTFTYVNNVNKGKATIVITAVDDNAGGYAGSKAQNFSIVSRNLKNVADLFKKWLGL